MSTMTMPMKPQPEAAARAQQPASPVLEIRGLSAGYASAPVIRDVRMDIGRGLVTAIIGPSGCGKSTLIRCLNRMHEIIPGAFCEGDVRLEGHDVFRMDPVHLRRQVGMVFQRPNPFPTMSVYENVASGLRLNGVRDRKLTAERVEKSLRQAALWDEVKDRLDKPGVGLSGGQQQRLCIARALAVEPRVLLLDEPCSALDPIATARIEEALLELKGSLTMVIVTHNMQQAARVSDRTAFLLMGDLVEYDETQKIFTSPADKRTEDYITGRFG